MNIAVTTPRTKIPDAVREANDAKAGKVTHYFRRLSGYPKNLKIGEKIFYVEKDFITGFAIVEAIADQKGNKCESTNKEYKGGVFVWMRCDSWKWIEPIPMKGFRNYRYITTQDDQITMNGVVVAELIKKNCHINYKIVGDWKDPKPELPKGKKLVAEDIIAAANVINNAYGLPKAEILVRDESQ